MPWDPPRTIGSTLLTIFVSVTTTLAGLWVLSLLR